MADNPYTRSVTVTVVELVPEKGELPYCSAWQRNGDNCPYRAKFMQNNNPLCGVHIGKPGTIFIPTGG